MLHDADRPEQAPQHSRQPFGLLVAALFVGAAALALSRVPNHDVAWLVHVAERVQRGAVLYVDVIETNPPLIVWLTRFPVWIAALASWAPIGTVRVSILGLVAVSLWLSWRRLQPLEGGDPRLARQGTLWALFVLLVLPGYHFGQREHILLILTLPFVLSTAAHGTSGAPSRGLAIAIGLSAGVGFALKPHFVAIWVALEAYGAWRGGREAWRRPETVVVALTLCGYAAAVGVWSQAYFSLIRTFAQAYLGFSAKPLTQLLLHGSLIFGLVVTGVFRLLTPTGARRELARACIVLLWATGAIAVVQGKGFAYHFYPTVAATYLAAGFLLATARRRESPRPKLAYAVLAVCGTIGVAATTVRELRVAVDPTRERIVATMVGLQAVVAQEAAGAPILALSAHPSVAFPLVTTSGASWAFRFSSLWALAGVRASHPPSTMPPVYEAAVAHPVERIVVDALAQDVRARAPQLLIVDAAPAKGAFRGEPFDFVQYLSGDPRLRAFFGQYSLIATVGHFRVYRRQLPGRAGSLAPLDAFPSK